MANRSIIALAGALVFPLAAAGQNVVIREARLVTMASGGTIEKGTVVVVGGRIFRIGKKASYRGSAVFVDGKGKTVLPGFVCPHSSLGFGSGGGWRVFHFRGRTYRFYYGGYGRHGYFPHLKVSEALNPFDRNYRGARRGGFTVVAVGPAGSGIPGQGSTVALDDWSVEKMLLVKDSFLSVSFSAGGKDAATLGAYLKRAHEYVEALTRYDEHQKKTKKGAKKTPTAAKGAATSAGKEAPKKTASSAYAPQPRPARPSPATAAKKPAAPKAPAKPADPDPKLLPFVKVFQRKMFLALSIGSASDFLHFREFFKTYDKHKPKILLIGGGDIYRVATRIAAAKYTVAIRPGVTYEPGTQLEINPVKILMAAGVEILALPSSDSASGFQGFARHLAMAYRLGFSRRRIYEAVTIAPARFLGIEKTHGSLEKGKAGDLVVFDGDPLDPSARIVVVVQRGRVVYRFDRFPGVSKGGRAPLVKNRSKP